MDNEMEEVQKNYESRREYERNESGKFTSKVKIEKNNYEFLCGHRLNEVLEDKYIDYTENNNDNNSVISKLNSKAYGCETNVTKTFLMEKPFLLFDRYSLRYTTSERRLVEIKLEAVLENKNIHEEFLKVKKYIETHYKMTSDPYAKQFEITPNNSFSNWRFSIFFKIAWFFLKFYRALTNNKVNYTNNKIFILDDYTSLHLVAKRFKGLSMLFLHVESLSDFLDRFNKKIMQGKGKSPKYLESPTTVWLASSTKTRQPNKQYPPFGWAMLEFEEIK